MELLLSVYVLFYVCLQDTIAEEEDDETLAELTERVASLHNS